MERDTKIRETAAPGDTELSYSSTQIQYMPSPDTRQQSLSCHFPRSTYRLKCTALAEPMQAVQQKKHGPTGRALLPSTYGRMP
jgi:hypothetical protein